MNIKQLILLGLSFCGANAFSAGLSYDFETNFDDWAGRGENVSIELSTDQHHNGNQSLFVSNRTDSWHGALIQNDFIEPGKTYTFSVYVFSKTNTRLNLSLQYTSDGSDSYPCVKEADVYAYSWTELAGEIVIPEDATNIQPYIQAPNDVTLEFYIDDFTCNEKAEDLIDFSNQVSLKALFADYFKIGTAVTASEITPKNAKNMVLHHFNSITAGNELKPDCLLDQDASISDGNNVNPQVKLAASTKTVLKFCSQNKIPIRGHVFVWHSQTPDWFFNEGFESNGRTVSADIMTQRMENYIKNVVEAVTSAYPDLKIYAWDVVNEAYVDNGSLRSPGSNYQSDGCSRWMEIYGDNSFIYKAFEFARKYVPTGCMLYYNDFNEYIDAKRDAIYNLVKDLYAKGLCDGVGMQSHLSVNFPSVELYKQAVEKYASIGCDIQVTELDITLEGTNFNTQANIYKELFDIYRQYKDKISSVTFWGINDEISWRKEGQPLIFSNYQPKPAYDKIIEGMELPTITEDVQKEGNIQITSMADNRVLIDCTGSFTYQIYHLNGQTIEEGNGVDQQIISLSSTIQLIKIIPSNNKAAVFKIITVR